MFFASNLLRTRCETDPPVAAAGGHSGPTMRLLRFAIGVIQRTVWSMASSRSVQPLGRASGFAFLEFNVVLAEQRLPHIVVLVFRPVVFAIDLPERHPRVAVL